jgi:hypothetical protein
MRPSRCWCPWIFGAAMHHSVHTLTLSTPASRLFYDAKELGAKTSMKLPAWFWALPCRVRGTDFSVSLVLLKDSRRN